jgi:PAS domain S-box-containing protein
MRLHITALQAQLEDSAVTRLTDSLLDGFALLDPASVVLEVNPALCAMTGFSAGELVGTSPPHPCWHPDQVTLFLQALAETLSGRPRPWHLDFVRKDGERFPALLTPSVLRRDDGEIVSVTLLVKDLSERRRFEAALAESEELFRLTFDQAPIGAVLTDLHFRFRLVNDAFCEMLGYSRSELLALAFPDITHPHDATDDIREVGRLGKGEADEYVREKRYISKDGATLWGRVVVRPVVGTDGSPIAHLAMIDDITGRKRALDDLRESEQRLHTVLDAAHEGIILQARDGTLLTFNKAAEAVFGVAETSVVGVSALGLDWETIHDDGSPWPPDEHPTMLALKSGTPVLDVVMGVLRGAQTRWLRVNAHPIIPEGENEPVAAVVSFSDETERLEAERALKESEERNRLLLRNANDAVFVHDIREGRPGVFIEVNDRACELLGYSRDELLALDVSAVDTAEQSERTPAIVADLLKTGQAVFETEHLTKDGRRVPVEISASTFDMQGRPVVLSVARDISERLAADTEMKRMRHMRDVAEQVARVGSWRWDMGTKQATWSPEMYRLFDIDPGEFDGDSWKVIEARVPAGDLERVRQVTGDALESGAGAPIEYQVVHRDGSEHLLHCECTIERDDAGRPVALVGYYQDITAQRTAEQALRDAEEHYRSLFEQSPIPVWLEDLSAVRAWFDDQDGVTDWEDFLARHPEHAATCAGLVRIVSCNQASLEFFGVASRDELVVELPRLFAEESYAPFREQMATLAGGGTRFAAEVSIVDLEGARRIVDLRLSVVPGFEARLDRVLASFIDVTENRRAEAEIRRLNEELHQRVLSRTEQLDASNRELEALAYSIAHDVRAPLRTIDGFSAAVMEDELEHLSKDGDIALRRVRNAAQTLARLLDDLMGLSHVSRRELARYPIDVTSLAEEVGEETAGDHPSRQVTLRVAPDLTADADPGLVRLILRELLGNAWKFTEPAAHAHVDVGALELDGERAFFVRDDGVGFDMRYAEHLFGIFQRMHPPGQFEGDGVGLATVQRLVRRHGGRVWAESELGRGTTIYFTLPAEGAGAGDTL